MHFAILFYSGPLKKPFPIEPRKPSINSRFYLYGYYSDMFFLSYIFSILSYYKYICL